MSAPPPSYNDSLRDQGQGGYQPSYGATNQPPPPGMYAPPPPQGVPPPYPATQGAPYPPQGGPYPPQGGPYPPQGGPYPPQGGPYPPQGGPYPPQYAPVGPVDPSKGYPVPPSYQQQSHSSTSTSVVVQPQQSVVLVGGCPACRVGVLEDDFTCCGVLCAILFFPIGILCCLAMRQRRCANCGSVFG